MQDGGSICEICTRRSCSLRRAINRRPVAASNIRRSARACECSDLAPSERKSKTKRGQLLSSFKHQRRRIIGLPVSQIGIYRPQADRLVIVILRSWPAAEKASCTLMIICDLVSTAGWLIGQMHRCCCYFYFCPAASADRPTGWFVSFISASCPNRTLCENPKSGWLAGWHERIDTHTHTHTHSFAQSNSCLAPLSLIVRGWLQAKLAQHVRSLG